MKAENIKPFIDSVIELYSTMLSCVVQRGEISLLESFSNGHDEVIALIGLSGRVRGTVALAFPVPTALRMVERLLGAPMTSINNDVLDAVAELVNIVAGGAKARIADQTCSSIDLSLPTVVHGQGYHISSPSYARWLDIPFVSDLGPFTLRVIFES